MSRMGYVLLFLFVLLGPTPLVGGAVWGWRGWSEHRGEGKQERAGEQAGWIGAEAVIVACSPNTRNARTGDWTYRWESEWTDKSGQKHRSTGVGASCGTRYPIL